MYAHIYMLGWCFCPAVPVDLQLLHTYAVVALQLSLKLNRGNAPMFHVCVVVLNILETKPVGP